LKNILLMMQLLFLNQLMIRLMNQSQMLLLPILASSKSGADAFLNEPSVQEIFRMNTHANMSLIGIGALTKNASIFKFNIANENDFKILRMKGAVGDLLSHFIDSHGGLIESEFNERLISTPIERLKDYKNTIAVAGGSDKFEAIKAALLGKYINVLITDETTARRLIE
jgi:lsr operon transcriptional repressor